MKKYNVAFSLNREMIVDADDDVLASLVVKQKLKEEGIDLETYTYEEFDCREEEEEE